MGEIFISQTYDSNTLSGFTRPMQVITKSTTWTCPASGEYYISCIGQGGSNAGADVGSYNDSKLCVATGGGGGISESKLSLKKDEPIIITIDAGVSSFGNYLSATGGSDVKTNNNTFPLGNGGDGSGGNIGNFKGEDGKRSTNLAIGSSLQGGGTSSEAKYGGARGGIIYADNSALDISGTLAFAACPTSANLGMYPYGSSQGFGSYGGHKYGNEGYVKNGAVIIELLK